MHCDVAAVPRIRNSHGDSPSLSPWAKRGGFDMEGTSVTGFTLTEGDGGPPRFPPTLVMND